MIIKVDRKPFPINCLQIFDLLSVQLQTVQVIRSSFQRVSEGSIDRRSRTTDFRLTYEF